MSLLFPENFPDISTQSELNNLLSKNSAYDPYYVVSGSIPDRRELFENLYKIYKDHADTHFLQNIKHQFHERTWEMYVGCSLLSKGIDFVSNDEGPDFLIENHDKKIWIECVTCKEGNGNDKVPPFLYGSFQSVPENEMCMRIANAIQKKYSDYSKKFLNKIVSPEDIYIIAVNSGALPFPDGAIPLILRCLFAVGHMTITFPRDGSESVHYWSQIRSLKKKNGSEVPMDFFLNKEHVGISGALYCGNNVLNHAYPIGSDILGINNPIANQPFPLNIKTAFKGYYPNASDKEWSLTPQ